MENGFVKSGPIIVRAEQPGYAGNGVLRSGPPGLRINKRFRSRAASGKPEGDSS
jgi:hypothetical protein